MYLLILVLNLVNDVKLTKIGQDSRKYSVSKIELIKKGNFLFAKNLTNFDLPLKKFCNQTDTSVRN